MFFSRPSFRFPALIRRRLHVREPSTCAALAILAGAFTACGADGTTDPTPEASSPVVTTPAPNPAPPSTPGEIPTGTPPPPPVVPNPPSSSTTPAPVPAVPTVTVPNNPNPVPVPPPPPSTDGESGSEPDQNTDGSAPAPSSGETPDVPKAGTGFYTKDGVLYDVNGTEFIMRGVNYPYAWYAAAHDTQQQFQAIAATGANAVRVVLATGDQWTRTSGADLTNIITWAKANKLVAVLEVHDATGYGDNTAPHPEKMLDFWKSAEILNAINGQEAYTLVNIANEGFGNSASDEWQSFYTMAVADLRAAGIKHTFVVDAPFWGQDWTNCMRDGQSTHPEYMFSCDANAVYDADPDQNTVFSVHMYDVYGSAEAVTSYFDRFLSKGVPLLVGEFASDHGASGNVDEATIMALSEQHGVGYLGWSWSGNGEGLETLDMTAAFNAGSLTPWGERLINGENGLKQTGAPCTCFD